MRRGVTRTLWPCRFTSGLRSVGKNQAVPGPTGATRLHSIDALLIKEFVRISELEGHIQAAAEDVNDAVLLGYEEGEVRFTVSVASKTGNVRGSGVRQARQILSVPDGFRRCASSRGSVRGRSCVKRSC